MDQMDHQHMNHMTTGNPDEMGGMTGMTGMHMTTSGMHMGGGGMKMYFHLDYLGETVLFKGWQIHDVGTLILSFIGVFLFALLYEALKFARQWLVEYAASRQTARFGNMDINGRLGYPMQMQKQNVHIGASPFTAWHLLQTALHVIQTFISYMLMMVFMTYNGYLCIALIAGAGVGYFAFGWRPKVVVNVEDHCH